jgi:hypothetical protein
MGGVALRWASLVNVFAGSCCIRPAGWPSYVSSGAIRLAPACCDGDPIFLVVVVGGGYAAQRRDRYRRLVV